MKNNKLEVREQGQKIYDIYFRDSFEDLTEAMSGLHLSGRKICIVTESHVAPLYLKEIYDLLSPVCAKVTTFSFSAGEAHKQLKTIEHLYEQLIRNHFDRKDLIVALGGGVVGDMAGFAAATYLRGIDFIQVPTTLLSQVDSSIGGKTGVDFIQYKNMVGAFHQPKLVYINVNTLKTLPEREFSSGMAEVIKHGLIKDREYYHWIRSHKSEILSKDPGILTKMIKKSCDIKRQVVEADPKEQGERALLNFGHTLGHAVETLMDFSLLHGECVAIGCRLALKLSEKRGMISAEETKEAGALFDDFHLDQRFDRLTPEQIIETTKSDKKMSGGHIRFILLRNIGEACIDLTVSDEEMTEVLGEELK
ncbi:3-dehydroquinate synthase [Anaerostipes sp.]|uniref:3-dehydroquinate synthase n=1 Tax=Anaerostipes sp. TaxID=1872530 RepID=UPI0025C40B28|nr:3-dehydroquinate synthase [Anaerostipes sp.]MBS7008177.1 3-dehydroquinate synthase [Anaerostipes sp.]